MNSSEWSALPTAHQRSWELLPWYVNETLDADERAEVRAHVGACLVCTREVRRLAGLRQALEVPTPEHACHQAYRRLTARIERSGGQRWLLGRWWQALGAAIEPAPLMLGAVLLVGSSLIAAGIVMSGNEESGNLAQPFQTLGARSDARTDASHPLLRVVLREPAAQAQVERWLERHAARMVEGPSPIGVLTVEVLRAPRGFALALAEIRNDPATLFVEPVNWVGAHPDRTR